jgi:hypothetical protein
MLDGLRQFALMNEDPFEVKMRRQRVFPRFRLLRPHSFYL